MQLMFFLMLNTFYIHIFSNQLQFLTKRAIVDSFAPLLPPLPFLCIPCPSLAPFATREAKRVARGTKKGQGRRRNGKGGKRGGKGGKETARGAKRGAMLAKGEKGAKGAPFATLWPPLLHFYQCFIA